MSSNPVITSLVFIVQAVVVLATSRSALDSQSASTVLGAHDSPLKIDSDSPVSSITSAQFGLLQSLDFESAEIRAGLDLHNVAAAQSHECNLKGFESERFREISSGEQFAGRQSIVYTVNGTSGLGPPKTEGLDYFGNGTDKIHHWIVPKERTEDALMEFGRPYYFGFAFKIDKRSEVPVPGNGVIIFQVWQGPPFCPPLKVHLINLRDGFHFAVSGRNNVTGSNPSARWEIIQEGVPIEKDQWYRCVLKTVIRHHNMAEPGQAEVWMAKGRGELQKTASWTGPIGYDPLTKANYDGRTDVPYPRSDLVPTIGIYRERQLRQLTLYFDNVRYATDWFLADPLEAGKYLATREESDSTG
jgi:hypothetical protein